MGVFRSLSFISAMTGLHWEYAKTPPDTSLARSSLLPQSNASRQLIRYIWCNLVSSVFSATLWIHSDSCRVYRSYYETFDPFPGKHVDPLLRYSCLALRAAPKIATVAMLWRFVQAFPNQMIETTTDRNFLAWKRSHVIQRLRKKTWASWIMSQELTGNAKQPKASPRVWCSQSRERNGQRV